MPDHQNVEFLKRIAKEIESLLPKVVFVGGATATIFMTEPEHIRVARETIDVDITLDVTRREFYQFENALRKLGFEHDKETTFRFLKDDIILDVMPTDEKILGFSNRWYKEAVFHAQTIDLGSHSVSVISFPYFIATKLEAFQGRGKGDYFGSKDMEDIISVLGGRRGFLKDLLALQGGIRKYLVDRFRLHLQHNDFDSAVTAHLPQGNVNRVEKDRVLGDLAEFCMQ